VGSDVHGRQDVQNRRAALGLSEQRGSQAPFQYSRWFRGRQSAGQMAARQMGPAGLMGRARFYCAALTALTLAGLLLRLAGLDAQPLWLDEAFSLWVARLPLQDIPAWVTLIDHHPPLYYFMLHGWRASVGESEWAVRSLSALASVLTIPLLAAATRRLLGCEAALAAALLAAVAPFQVRYAQEARMYSLAMVTVTAALAATAQLLTAWEARGRAWIGLAGCQAAAMLTHHMAAVLFPLALNLGVLLVWLRVRAENLCEGWEGVRCHGFGRRWLGAQGLALLLWLPWAWSFVQQVLAVDRDFWIPPPTVSTVGGWGRWCSSRLCWRCRRVYGDRSLPNMR
jgi:mannosyltransferase